MVAAGPDKSRAVPAIDTAVTKAQHAIAIENNLATWLRQMAVWSSIGLAFFAFLYHAQDNLNETHRMRLVAMHSVPLLLLVIGIITGVQALESYIRRAHTFHVQVSVSHVACSIVWILILLAIFVAAGCNLVKLYRERLTQIGYRLSLATPSEDM